MMQVAIIAGGLATRLGSASVTTPVSLMRFAGKPFIEHQLAFLRSAGTKRIVMCLGHLGAQVEAAVGNGARVGLTIQYSHDGARLLGTGGALRRAVNLLDERFLVLYGDSYLTCDYAAVAKSFTASRKSGLMVVHGKLDANNADFRYGLGALHRDALMGFPGDTRFDLVALYQGLANNDLAVHEVTERPYEIGSPAGLDETRRLLETRS